MRVCSGTAWLGTDRNGIELIYFTKRQNVQTGGFQPEKAGLEAGGSKDFPSVRGEKPLLPIVVAGSTGSQKLFFVF